MVACDTSTPGVPIPAGNLNFAVYRYNCSTDQNPTDIRISIWYSIGFDITLPTSHAANNTATNAGWAEESHQLSFKSSTGATHSTFLGTLSQEIFCATHSTFFGHHGRYSVLGNKAGQTYINTSESGAVRDIGEWTVEETFTVLREISD